MSATYVPITELEFDVLCKSEKGWIKNTTGKEIVYEFTPKKNPDVVVKVYSSITNGVSRKCGQDAIRIVKINTKTDRALCKSKKVYRTPNWEIRVKVKVLEILAL